MTKKDVVPVRGYLLHLTHYDPRWYLRKRRERPIDLALACEIIDELARVGFNLLIVDCEDGLIYRSHPELARRYSISQEPLRKLIAHARKRRLELVPKLNFSHSRHHRHDYWFRPYTKVLDSDSYWKAAFELIDELIRLFCPRRFFHIGMDEDDARTSEGYAKAILTLRHGLRERGLRTIIWNDTAGGRRRPWHARKSLAAEKVLPKDIVQCIWDYRRVRPAVLKRLMNEGFDVWVAPGPRTLQVLQWEKYVLQYGAKGLVMTTWLPCRPRNRFPMLNLIQMVGPIYQAGLF